MTNNEPLKAAMKSWIQAVVDQTQPASEPPTRQIIMDTAAGIPEYRMVLGELDKDAVITEHFNSLIESDALFEPVRITPGEILNRFLNFFFNEQNRLFFEPVHYEKVYNYFEKVFYQDYIEYRAIAPVSKLLIHVLRETKQDSKIFDDDTEPFELAPDLIIRALKDEERKMVYQLELVRRMQPRMGDFINAVCADYRFPKKLTPLASQKSVPNYLFDQPSPLETKMYEINQLLYETVAILRLFKPGSISCGGVVHFGRHLLVGGIQYPFPGEPMQLSPPMPLYILSREDFAPLQNLRNQFQQVKTDPASKNLILALRRLNYARTRDDFEDKTIDLMIAAETLAKPPTVGDKSSVIAEYFSTFFPDSAANIKELMRKVYGMRSAIMHDGSLEVWSKKYANRRLNVFEIINAAEETVRIVLTKEIEKNHLN